MSWTPTDTRTYRVRRATVTAIIAVAACTQPSAVPPTPPSGIATPSAAPTGAVTGTLRFLERESADTAIGPVIVMLEAIDPAIAPSRPTQLFHLASSTEHFDPGFSAVRDGDLIVFVNEGPLSHRFFSAGLGPDVQIPVRPAGSSEPQRLDHTGELRFFCSLHPDENFGVLVTADAFFAAVDRDGRYHVGLLPEGAYRLSIWSPRLQGLIRTVEVESGRTLVETIWLDPDLIRR
jgi:plastocyanin